ncbi:hypothetical protein BGZ99_000606 [Dissophora globulifera]|uniref:Uncharacterized protein n=1 Tax=Dissophora globulifera TaxID=979702 RepID=A0A9P6RS72_9FUNG|nr:hypothetical protein BGZ99_000606 [Dissophora globulifera]
MSQQQQHFDDEAPASDQPSPTSRAIRSYPRLAFTAVPDDLRLRLPHLPLPEREDTSSGRPRAITFGTLKKASMANRSASSSSAAGATAKRSKLVTLPSYLLHTTFKQHFQPETVAAVSGDSDLDGEGVDLGIDAASRHDREPSKRRRLHVDGTRRRHLHFHRGSDTSSLSSREGSRGGGGGGGGAIGISGGNGDSGSSSSGSSGNSSGSESGNSSCENDSGTTTPKPGRRPSLRYQLPSRWSSADKTEKTQLSEDDLQVHYTGWEPQSWGYHGDDGNSFGGCGNGRPFGPVFTTGDTIGCGVNFRDMSLFYTKNGAYLGKESQRHTRIMLRNILDHACQSSNSESISLNLVWNIGVAFRDLKGPLYPTVGMRTTGEIVEANFGQQGFIFDIDEYVKDEKVEAWQTLETTLLKATAADKHHVNTLSQSLSHLVLSYMIHQGYSESAKQFSSDLMPKPLLKLGLNGSGEGSSSSMAGSAPAELNHYSLAIIDAERRKLIRKAIMSGDIDQAMQLLETHYPGVMANNEDMVLQLRCRKFVELVHLSSSPLRSLDHLNEKGTTVIHHTDNKMNGHSNNRDTAEDTDMKDATIASCDLDVEDMDVDQDLEGLGTLKEAFRYGHFLQEQYKDNPKQSVQNMLIDAFAVLAYAERLDHHSGSKSGHFHSGTKPVTREKVATTVNTAILTFQNLPKTAPLETVYRQTSVAMSELTRLGVGEAAFFDIDEDCLQ